MYNPSEMERNNFKRTLYLLWSEKAKIRLFLYPLFRINFYSPG